MSAKIEQIENMSMDEVIENYNRVAGHTTDSLNTWIAIYYNKKNELLLKKQEKINKQMLSYTKAMTIMTVVVVVATILNLIVAIVK